MRNIFALLIAVSLCVPAFAETNALTIHFDKDPTGFANQAGFQECVTVFVSSNDPKIHAFKVTILFIDESGTPQSRTQTVDRWVGEFPNASAVHFYVSKITGLKPATVVPLVLSADPVNSR